MFEVTIQCGDLVHTWMLLNEKGINFVMLEIKLVNVLEECVSETLVPLKKRKSLWKKSRNWYKEYCSSRSIQVYQSPEKISINFTLTGDKEINCSLFRKIVSAFDLSGAFTVCYIESGM